MASPSPATDRRLPQRHPRWRTGELTDRTAYLSREETTEFTRRLHRDFQRRKWCLTRGLETLQIPRSTFHAWATTGAWGRRISHKRAWEIGEFMGFEVPAPRSIETCFTLPDGNFEQWIDDMLSQVSLSKGGGGPMEAGLLASVGSAIFSRWAAMGLQPTLAVDYGRTSTVRLLAYDVTDTMSYSVTVSVTHGDVTLILHRIPRERRAAKSAAVGAITACGAAFIGLEKRLMWLKDRTRRRLQNKEDQPSKVLQAFEKDVMEFFRKKTAQQPLT